MVKYVVLYEGTPQDAEAFDRHYAEVHVPIIARWPRIRRIEVNKGARGGDFYQLCEFTFDTSEDLEAALASPERQEAAEDRLRFPPFDGQIRHQAVEIVEHPIA